jgi:crossover junction endodeoxyribonuclease RusA
MEIIKLNNIPPSKKNNRRLFKTNAKMVNIPSVAYTAWEYSAVIESKRQTGSFVIPICLRVFIGLKNKKRRDLDNILTSVCDMLVKAKIIKDDSINYIHEMSIKYTISNEEYTTIHLIEVENE